MTARAVDSSYDWLTREEAICLRRYGTELFIQCLWTGREKPVHAHDNIAIALGAGLSVAGYISLTPAGRGDWHVEQGLRGLGSDLLSKLVFIAVDVELDGIWAEQISEAVNSLQGRRILPIIYTSYNAWRNYVRPGNIHGFGDLYLWNALWDLDPDVDFPRMPYGGWHPDHVLLEQYSGGSYECGQFVDRNTLNEAAWLKVRGETDSMTADERRDFDALKRQVTQLVGETRALATIARVLNERLAQASTRTEQALEENRWQQGWLNKHQDNAGVHERV